MSAGVLNLPALFYSYALMISRKTNKGVCIGLKRCPAGEKNVSPEELTHANTHKLTQLLYTEGSKVVGSILA